MYLDDGGSSATVTLGTPGGPRTVRLAPARRRGGRGRRRTLQAPGPPRGHRRGCRAAARRSGGGGGRGDGPAHALPGRRPQRLLRGGRRATRTLAWAARGAGRLLRSPTVFEDVVKTVCTTNCAWSATERMVGALVGRLGEPAPGAPPGRRRRPRVPHAGGDGGRRRRLLRGAWPAPATAGRTCAPSRRRVAAGELDLEALLAADRDELPDEEVASILLALPGVGPYAAAHIMMLLGRHSRLVLDSWTRPKYARLHGQAQGQAGRRPRPSSAASAATAGTPGSRSGCSSRATGWTTARGAPRSS